MSKTDRINILVIMSDQHSRHVLGSYGNEIVRTPNLDRLAADGMRMDNCYCPAPLCVPSRMSFMTGRTPSRNRCWDNRQMLHSGIPTWAHVLGAAGYETVLIGRMHFVGPDQRHGFEGRPMGEWGSSPPGSPIQGGPMWQHFPPSTCGQLREAVEVAGRGHTHYQWFDEQVTETACRWLRQRSSGTADRPFAAVIGYVLPHCPFIAPKELFDYYCPLVDIPFVEESQPPTVTRLRQLRGLLEPPLRERRVRVARAAYFGLVEHMDRMIGQVLDVLADTRQDCNTLVIYTSDHGEMAGEHGCWWKSQYYEGSVGVPMIARLDGAVPAGMTCHAVCNLMDLSATFAEIAGVDFPAPIDGRSLWRTLRGDHPSDWHDETFSELVDPKSGRMLTSRMVRSGPWKLWVFHDEDRLAPALFNLAEDPGETHDLSGDSRFADIREELVRKLYGGWDPGTALSETTEQLEGFRAIADWGRAVHPRHPDEIVLPPSDYEADVELL